MMLATKSGEHTWKFCVAVLPYIAVGLARNCTFTLSRRAQFYNMTDAQRGTGTFAVKVSHLRRCKAVSYA